MRRIVEPELLDELQPADLRAIGSRGDLQRLNGIMGHAAILARALRGCLRLEASSSRRLQLMELGAGDGTLLLKVAQQCSMRGLSADVILVDRQNLISEQTQRAFAALNWSIKIMTADAQEALERAPQRVDVICANLFLHHFADDALRALLQTAAQKTNLFVACEPRRCVRGLVAARFLGLIGCNAITRHDARVSVRAGFAGKELSVLWPAAESWELHERSAGFFSHFFSATRHA